MAKETVTRLIDDLDGSSAANTVTFSYDGNSYEIDLSKKNANALEKALAPYLSAARKVRGSSASRRRAPRASAKTSPAPDLNAIREWARANGFQVAERGRIAASVIEAYQAAV